MKTIELVGGPWDGACAEPHDGKPAAQPGEIIHIRWDEPNNLPSVYLVRTGGRKADYKGDVYEGLPAGFWEGVR